jgi:cytochrome c biogenesis protein CcmG/thiol:disulfide interchange protein DsbE
VPESSPRLPWRVVALSTGLALVAATATYAALSGREEPSTGGATTGTVQLTPESEAAPLGEAAFVTFEGEEVPLTSLQGTPTVVNFFASTCTPCITEMPAFEEVHQALDATEVAFLGLAVADAPEAARALVEETGVTYPTAGDPEARVISALGGSVLPTTVLLDAGGRVVARHSGPLDADELRALLADELGVRA